MADLDDPEIKAAIKAAIDEAKKDWVSDQGNFAEQAKKWRRIAQEKDAINPDDYNKLQDNYDQLLTKHKDIEKQLKSSTAAIEEERKARASESGYVQKLLIDNGLTDALQKAGIKPELSKAVKAMFATQAQIKIDGDNRSAIIGDKSLSDFVTEWSKSDEGKHFVAAPLNGGGNAQGGGQGKVTHSKTATGTEFYSWNPAQQMEFSKAGGKIVD